MSATLTALDSVIAATKSSSGDATLTDQSLSDPLQRFLFEVNDDIAFAIYAGEFGKAKLIDKIGVSRWLNQQIAQLDCLINEQINVILHHQRVQQLESSWRGLWMLVDSADVGDNVKIKLLPVSWRELSKDIERAPDFDQSGIFHLVYNLEFGTAGGEPFGVLLGDYEISHRPHDDHPYDDIFTLQGISRAAAAAFAPFICGAAPQLFGLDDFDTLGMPLNLQAVFRQQEYSRWRTLRQAEDSRFLAITLPRTLMRKPYHADSAHRKTGITEQCESNSSKNYLWGNACFALGTVLIREFSEVGWFSHIRGAPRDYLGGGLVTDLPNESFKTDSSAARYKMTTQVLITDSLERELAELGIIALCHCFDTRFAVFNSCPSIQSPRQYSKKSANANARISAMLQQVLCASRFAQYIKVMIRDKVGSYITDKDCERHLQNWLDKYTTGREDLSWEMLARYPLREARVIVQEEPGKPGSYQSIIHLKTHYTVDNLVSELKLTTALNQAGLGTIR